LKLSIDSFVNSLIALKCLHIDKVVFIIFTIFSVPIHIIFWKAFWWSGELFNVGFFLHIFQLCFFTMFFCWLYPLCIVNKYCKTSFYQF
jgi:hypothetical protein